ncbi:MAG: 50S ribosomal protein L4 [Candidatus Omnitrophica bacterium]|nr:50S ribosomal protein L4 [Candidatus Omnitrophota bacterium]
MTNTVIYNIKGEKVGNLKLNEKLFDAGANKPLLQQAVTMYMANQRKGAANAKGRAEVRGGGKKPWRQKGTGRARAGSIRSPLWVGGGVTFGPQPKDWHYQLPKKIKRQALAASLSVKLSEKNLTIIDELKLQSHKTKELAGIVKKMKLDAKKLLIVSQDPDKNLKLAAGNIAKISLHMAQDINAHQILINDSVLIEKAALETIEKKLTGAS